jgi:hypothetical protein
MGIFNWFDKKEVMVVEETVVTNIVSQYEFSLAFNDLAVLIQELTAVVHDNKTQVDKLSNQLDQFVGITNTRLDLIQKLAEENKSEDAVNVVMLNTAIQTVAYSLKQEIDDVMNLRSAIVDPAPVSQGPPIGWMNALRDEVMQQSHSARMEMKSYVDDCITAYDVNEDVELEERLANLSPISPEEIDALYMDEAETTTLAQKTVNGFRAEVYNKALADIRLIPTSRATISAVRAFLVKFVESMKPV